MYNEARKLQNFINPFGIQNLNLLLGGLYSKFKPIPNWIYSPSNRFVAIGSEKSIFN